MEKTEVIMEIKDVTRATEVVAAGGLLKLTFRIQGALGAFQFPFQNDSLTEKTIIFMKEE